MNKKLNVLTKEMVVKMIILYKEEWSRDGDWWWGTTKSFVDLPYGVDVNVYRQDELSDELIDVYSLTEPDEDGFSSISNGAIMKFNLTEWFKNNEH